MVVRRPSGEFLLLHRHHNGPEYEGDWAWTSPSGARLPGEPILAGAVRELYEETGLSGCVLRPVDLSGPWAIFATDVPDSATVVLDPEHDRYEWVTPAAAVQRLAPDPVVAAFQRGSTVALPSLTLRPLTHGDLPTLLEWFAEPHVAQWFPGPQSLTDAQTKYGPRIDGTHHVRVHLLEVDGRAAGFLQCYPLAAEPGYAADLTATAMDDPGAVAIDYLIGSPGLVGGGLGPQAIWAYLRDVVLPAFPAAHSVLASPQAENTRSVRALEKAGFLHLGDAAVHSANGVQQQSVCVLDRARVFGN